MDELMKWLVLGNLADDGESQETSEDIVVDTIDVQTYIKDESETAEDFVQRLPPSKILRSGHADFLAINSTRNTDGLENFLRRGQKLLRSYEEEYINEVNVNLPAFVAEDLKWKVMSLAKREKFLEGSWLLFPSTDEVDYVWLKIIESTIDGYLGINAKINRRLSKYVIRVYTKDFTDKADVLRVLEGLNYSKLLGNGIHYECTAFAKLKIPERRIFNIAPSIYRSKDYIQLQGDDNYFLYGIIEENESAQNFVARLLPSNVLYTKSGLISLFKEESDFKHNEARSRAKSAGNMLLEEYKSRIENASVFERSSIIEELENKLKNVAVECDFVKGVWIAYARYAVNFLWLKIVEETMKGTIGINAKVQRKGSYYEIRVITKDFNDESDVMRVLTEMRKLGFRPPFFYKTHLYSKLRIKRNNSYGLNPYLHMDWTEGPRGLRCNLVKELRRRPRRGNR